jgi:hypothetical protein
VPVVVVALEDVAEHCVGLPLPRLGVVRVRQLVEDVSYEYAGRLAGLGLLAPVDHDPIRDVLHELAGDPLDLLALLVSQNRIRLCEQVEHRELGLG